MIPTSKPKLNTHPWCIVRQPNMQRLVVARFHRRGDEFGIYPNFTAVVACY
ncbi:hypothetical protein [Microcoleus sp. herbarium12]|uniref:hypothetical protein n=1 Tax=Microcoleus sp. herbarium12 TaxID=3055437 RepID=UPI002FD5A672